MTPLLMAAVLGSAALAAPARPAPSDGRPLVALVALPPGAAQDLARELPAVVQQEVRRSVQYAWVDPPAVSVDELMLALNCNGLDAPCLRAIAGSLKTDGAVLVTAKGNTLNIMLVQGRAAPKQQSVPISDVTTTLAAVRQAMRTLLGPVKPTRLVVQTTPAGATVLLDGKPVGQAPVTLTDLADGPHQLTLQRDGYQPRKVDVVVGIGESQEVNVALVAAAPAPAPKVAATVAPEEKAASTETSGGGLRLPLLGSGGAVAGLGGLVTLGGLLVGLGGLASYAAYWTVLLLNPGIDLGGSTMRIGDSPNRAGGFATMANAERFGILSYALGVPGAMVFLLGALITVGGAAVLAAAFIIG